MWDGCEQANRLNAQLTIQQHKGKFQTTWWYHSCSLQHLCSIFWSDTVTVVSGDCRTLYEPARCIIRVHQRAVVSQLVLRVLHAPVVVHLAQISHDESHVWGNYCFALTWSMSSWLTWTQPTSSHPLPIFLRWMPATLALCLVYSYSNGTKLFIWSAYYSTKRSNYSFHPLYTSVIIHLYSWQVKKPPWFKKSFLNQHSQMHVVIPTVSPIMIKCSTALVQGCICVTRVRGQWGTPGIEVW